MEDKWSNLVKTTEGHTFEWWVNRPYISPGLREKLKGVDVLIVPNEGYWEQQHLVYFPAGTEEVFASLKERQGLSVDTCIEDADYKELGLHVDWTNLPDVVVSLLAAPLVVNMLYDLIKLRLLKMRKQVPMVSPSLVRSSMTVVDRERGIDVKYSYEGPPETYLPAMTSVFAELTRSAGREAQQASDSGNVHPSRRGRQRRSHG
ncbi:MAG: hypothetical protein M1305_02780 [Candidatus Marsarchaeota archaeon]|nr:hypothetical protein [Candidatus Marsarchaeota archaeon]